MVKTWAAEARGFVGGFSVEGFGLIYSDNFEAMWACRWGIEAQEKLLNAMNRWVHAAVVDPQQSRRQKCLGTHHRLGAARVSVSLILACQSACERHLLLTFLNTSSSSSSCLLVPTLPRHSLQTLTALYLFKSLRLLHRPAAGPRACAL